MICDFCLPFSVLFVHFILSALCGKKTSPRFNHRVHKVEKHKVHKDFIDLRLLIFDFRSFLIYEC